MFWTEILTAYRRARRPPSLSRRRADMRQIAQLAELLRKKILYDPDIESVILDYFPADAIALIGREDSHGAKSASRRPPLLLRDELWPSLAEVLGQVRDRASALEPAAAMKAQLLDARRERVFECERPVTYFALALDSCFRRRFGKPMTSVVDAIARVAFPVHESWSASKAIENAKRKPPQ